MRQLHKKPYFLLILGLTLSICIIYFVKSFGERDFDTIKEKGVLRVSTDYNSINYYLQNGQPQGFQYDIVKILCDSLNLTAEWTFQNSLDQNIEDLNEDKIDLIARNIPITSELKSKLVFSKPIIHIKQVLVQRKAEFNNGLEPIRNQLYLAGKTVYVPKNSPSKLRLRNLADEIADTIIIKESDKYEAEQLLMLVAKGDIDYAVCDLQIAKANAQLLPELDIETAVSFVQLQAWGMRESAPMLKQAVDSFLVNFLQTKAYRDIYRKYYK